MFPQSHRTMKSDMSMGLLVKRYAPLVVCVALGFALALVWIKTCYETVNTPSTVSQEVILPPTISVRVQDDASRVDFDNDNLAAGGLDVLLMAPREERYMETVDKGHKTVMEGLAFAPEEIASFREGFSVQDDPGLVRFIRQSWLIGPSKLPLNLSKPAAVYPSQFGQDRIADELLQHRTRGFFVECGAADGEGGSNTLFLERKRNWTGLLIEPNTFLFDTMLAKRRRAYSVNACLSTKKETGIFVLKAAGYMGGLEGTLGKKHSEYMYVKNDSKVHNDPEHHVDLRVQCFSLYSLMLALGRRRIHYFSLDIEGAEIDVLRTIPFDKLYIDVISLEYRSWGGSIDYKVTLQRLAAFRRFFADTGMYREAKITPKIKSSVQAEIDREGSDVFFERIHRKDDHLILNY